MLLNCFPFGVMFPRQVPRRGNKVLVQVWGEIKNLSASIVKIQLFIRHPSRILFTNLLFIHFHTHDKLKQRRKKIMKK